MERRLVTIARGAAHPDTRLLILDEPTAGLPHEEAVRVIAAMKALVDADRSLILVSHHIEDIVAACPRVTLMRDGRTYRTLTGPEVNKDGIVRLLLASVSDMPISDGEERAQPDLGDDMATVTDVTGNYLNGISLSVRKGEVVGLAGILGSGASEVVQLLTGQLQPSGGRISIGRAQVKPSSPHVALRSGVGFVSGDRANLVIKGMSVSEHIALPALRKLTRGGMVSGKRERAWVRDSLERFSVKGTPEAQMTSLSGGNQQRALMARWAGMKVDLLVVDQPTVGVDLAGRAQVLSVLRQLAHDCGVVVAAEADELAAVCDRVLCLRRGRIDSELTGDDVNEERILSAIA